MTRHLIVEVRKRSICLEANRITVFWIHSPRIECFVVRLRMKKKPFSQRSIQTNGSSWKMKDGTGKNCKCWMAAMVRCFRFAFKINQNVWITKPSISILESKSPTHFYMRPKEPELDAEALDKNDSFYHTTKSLLVLFQIMGVMPIMRSAPGMLCL